MKGTLFNEAQVNKLNKFEPIKDVENSHLILENGDWPNFHDAEIHELNIWRGDMRPDDDVWIGPVITASFELCALKQPFIATIRFHDCEAIKLMDFNHQNAVYDLAFEFRSRGTTRDGSSLPPWIVVSFEQAFGAELAFRCMGVEAVQKSAIDSFGLVGHPPI